MTNKRLNDLVGDCAPYVVVALLLVLPLWLVASGGRAAAQTGAGTFAQPTGYTDCGIDGTLVMLNTTVQYDPLYPETELARWGLCSGRAGGGCDDNKLNTWGERRCITTESEASVTREALRWEYSGSCTPPRDTPYPDPQLIEDYGKVIGAFRSLRRRWEAACFARPIPIPTASPQPTATPVEPQPTPTVAPTPSPVPQATPAATPAPTPACEVCDRYEEMPARHRETYLAAPYWPRPLTKGRQRRLDEANAWTRAHPKTWYVPGVRSTPNVTSTLESVEWGCYPVDGGEECLAANALPGEAPMFVPRSPFAVGVRRCAP